MINYNIRHMAIGDIRFGAEVEKYLCNQACVVTEEKLRHDWRYVNCKNCLKKFNVAKGILISPSKKLDKNNDGFIRKLMRCKK